MIHESHISGRKFTATLGLDRLAEEERMLFLFGKLFFDPECLVY